MIEVDGLTKRYGDKTAVDGLSFVVEPGVVTGFLGPNGAGKSTTMRVIAGLDRPDSGTVRVNGKHYPGAAAPMSELGILLDARSVHPGLSARNNLLALARTAGIGRRRVDEVIELAGLGEVTATRAGGFSLGMGQRLGIAAALLGDPRVLMFDEPINGLDPEGVVWIRNLLRSLAAEGRTVFLSSHLMSEMSITADRLIIIGRGRLIAQTTVEDFLSGASGNFVRVRSPQCDALVTLLGGQGVTVVRQAADTLSIAGTTTEVVGELARANGLTVLELSAHQASLEDRYMELTKDSVDYEATEGGELAPARR
jgi:ABC-2 type transport system ATP-binding protein